MPSSPDAAALLEATSSAGALVAVVPTDSEEALDVLLAASAAELDEAAPDAELAADVLLAELEPPQAASMLATIAVLRSVAITFFLIRFLSSFGEKY